MRDYKGSLLNTNVSHGSVFGTANNFILDRSSKGDEIGAISGHAHDEILMLFRLFLTFQKCFFIHDIKLDMLSSLTEVSPDEHG